MQGLAHYADTSPTPSPPPTAGPSRLRDGVETPTVTGKRDVPSDTPIPKNKTKVKRPRRSSPSTTSLDLRNALPSKSGVNHTQTAESAPPEPAEEVDEDEIFRRITRPAEVPDLADWGIPPEVDPALASPQLKSKVEQYLRLTYEKDQHINTSLLSSTSFSNPHIYAKLVEYTSLTESSSHFPSPHQSWLTRHNLEFQIPKYGPSASSARQKVLQEESNRGKEAGKRGRIDFTSGRREKAAEAGGSRPEKEKERDRERVRGNGKGMAMGKVGDKDGEIWISRTHREAGKSRSGGGDRERERERGGVSRAGGDDRVYVESMERRDRVGKALGGVSGLGIRSGGGERERDTEKEREQGGRWSGQSSYR